MNAVPRAARGDGVHASARGAAMLADRALLVVAALVVFLVLGRDALLAETADALLGTSPFTPLPWLHDFATARWTGAALAALAIGFVHAAAGRIGGSRARAAACAASFAGLPVVWVCGTVASRWSTVLALAAIAFWLAAAVLDRRARGRESWPGAAGCAVVCALAGVVHPAAVWLLPLVVWLVVAERGPDAVRMPGLLALVAIALLGGWLADAAAGTGLHAAAWSAPRALPALDPLELLGSAHRELLRPMMPLSLLVVVAALRGGALRTLSLSVLAVPLVVLAQVVQPDATGLVAVPLAFPAAWHVARTFRARTCAIGAGLGAVVAALAIGPLGDDARGEPYAMGLRAHAAGRPTTFVWLRNPIEDAAVLVHAPEVRAVELSRAGVAAIDAELRAGRRVVLGLHTMAALLSAGPGQPELAALRAALTARFEQRLVHVDGFRGYELGAR